ncbi:MAG: hypothetical protein R8K20_01025, partial [Gallionellaceae bacterium]
VSALDPVLLEGLRQLCGAHKLELRSVTSYLEPVFNYCRNTIKLDPAWLIIHEPGYSLFALLGGGEIIAVNGVQHDSINDLPMLLDRENLACVLDKPCKSVYLWTPLGSTLASFPTLGYEFSHLNVLEPEGLSSSAEGWGVMAMSGAI